MAVTLTIAVGSVLLVVCGFTWVARREEVAEVARLLRLQLMTLDEIADGELCAVEAKVAGPAAVQDPVLEETVVYFEARVVRRDRGDVLYARTGGEAVRLEDGSKRSALVELVGAEIAVPTVELEEADQEPSPRMRALLEIEDPEGKRAHERSDAARYTLEHRAVRVGDTLTLVGVATRGDDGEARFTSRHPLFLTPEPLEALQARQRDDLKAMDRMLQIGLALGVACLLAAVVLGGVLA